MTDKFVYLIEWKIIEKKTKSDDHPYFYVYSKVLYFFWCLYDVYESLEKAKTAIQNYEKFLRKQAASESYEKEVWRSHHRRF